MHIVPVEHKGHTKISHLMFAIRPTIYRNLGLGGLPGRLPSRVHQNRTSPFASDFHRRLGYRKEFRSGNQFCHFLREAKPGGLQTGGFPTFFGKGPDCVADPFGTVPCRCSIIGRERGKGQIGKIPGPSPSKSGKSQKNRESPKKDKKGQKRKDKSRSGNPPV